MRDGARSRHARAPVATTAAPDCDDVGPSTVVVVRGSRAMTCFARPPALRARLLLGLEVLEPPVLEHKVALLEAAVAVARALEQVALLRDMSVARARARGGE